VYIETTQCVIGLAAAAAVDSRNPV
jgi:hypothetical protein